MEKSPKILPELKRADQIWEYTGIVMLLLSWIILIYTILSTDEKVPMHYNFQGEITRYGNPSELIILGVVSSLLFIGMTWINKYPHLFNYPVNITEKNALSQYTRATRMIRYLKTVITFLFLIIILQINQLWFAGIWFLPVLLLIIGFPVIYFTIRSAMDK
jgi:hypothetical protein